MVKETKILAVLFVVLALGAGGLWAEIIRINLTAEVIAIDDTAGLLEARINIGDIITGSYRYESTTGDSNPLDTVGDYWHYTWPYGISLSGGGFLFATDPDNVDFLLEVGNDHLYSAGDHYLLRSYNNLPLSNGTTVDHISWQLDDYSGMALSSDALPTTAPILEDWGEAKQLMIILGYNSGIGAHVTSVELVPEPATVLLLGLGSLAVLLKRRKA